jgi:hypothetical protein
MSSDWWKKAQELEAADKLAEAEEVIAAAMSPRRDPWDAQTAELYELRCKRLLREGKIEAAKAAAQKGYDFMLMYAAGSTSGGEGTARSREAEEYRRNLDAVIAQAQSRP